jgi:hypothetical protein
MFGNSLRKDGFAVKKLLALLVVTGFLIGMAAGCGSTTSSAKPSTPPAADKDKKTEK